MCRQMLTPTIENKRCLKPLECWIQSCFPRAVKWRHMNVTSSQMSSMFVLQLSDIKGNKKAAYSLPFVNGVHRWRVTDGFLPRNWLSWRSLVSWINHLPSVCWSTFWKSIIKHQLGCRFNILDSYLPVLVFWHMQSYMSWYNISFLGFLNILYCFKYSCTSIDIVFVLSTDISISKRHQDMRV